ncbi:hypothetical protein TFLX_02046 [Thermoflexales bacterium]|nr:hypothetical protein TFLX_02046 [Thermoflexales bacterium]
MTPKRLIWMLFIGLLGLWSLTLFSTSTASAGPLPPRPTPGSTPVVVSGQAGQGAAIEVQVSGARSTWWLAVQWQDVQKNWHTVMGWQGSFDEITTGSGSKLWWVAPADLGKGPFRWAIYAAKDGQLLAVSEAFDLPAKARTKLIMQVDVK